jgi:hypothetical protein
VDEKENVQAMNFFHGLDNAKYGAFKTSMLSGWATKANQLQKNQMKYIGSQAIG